jgi:hypothetical protein
MGKSLYELGPGKAGEVPLAATDLPAPCVAAPLRSAR